MLKIKYKSHTQALPDLLKFLVYCFLLFTVFSISSCENKKEISVILIGGQSNATGQGYIKNLPKGYKTDSSIYFYYSKYLRGMLEPENLVPLSNASERAAKFGPELGLGNTLSTLHPDKNFAIIKHALSGSNLYSQWHPGDNNRDSLSFGPEYKKFIKTVEAGMDSLRSQGYNPKIVAMTWQQGEADARDNVGMEISRAYGKNLRNFIERVREQFNQPEMVFVYGYVIPVPRPRFTGREEVRQAQRDVSEGSKSPISVKRAFVVNTDDLPLRNTEPNSPYPDDVVHFNTKGMLELGKRYAEKISENL